VRRAICARAESLWHSLPDQLRLQNSVVPYQDRSSCERDLLLGMRLTFLQTLFLTKTVAVTRGNLTSEKEELDLLQISREMLALTVEAVILRDQLVNSGTSLLWKVTYLQLPLACY